MIVLPPSGRGPVHEAGADIYRNILVAILAIGLMLVCVVGYVLYDAHVTAWTHAADITSNLNTAIRRDIDRTVETYDLSLKATLRGLQAPELDRLSPATRQGLLFDGATEAKHLGSVFIMDAAGHIVDDSAASPPRSGSFADRDYFTVHRDRNDVGLYISKPYKSRLADEWSIALSRRVNDAHGAFNGVVVGSVRYSYFTDLFSKLNLGPGGSISLFNLDGTAIYREPFIASQVGQDFSGASVFKEIRAGRNRPYEGIALADGQAKLFAFGTVGSLPLVLAVSMASTTVYADWSAKAAIVGVVSVILAVFGFLLVLSARSQNARRIHAEQKAVRSAQILYAYFDHSPDALFVVAVAPDGRLTYQNVNRTCESLTGLAAAAVLGREPAAIFDAEAAASIERRYRACIASGQTSAYEETRLLPAGRRDWHAILCPIRGPDGAVICIVGSARDMTEENRRQAAQRQAGKMEAVGRLTAGVAHDFNNYLQTITGSLEILIDEYLTEPEAVEYGQLARKAAESGARLTHRLLAFSRQQVLRPRRVGVTSLLTDTRRLLGSSGFGADIQVKIAIEPFTDDVQLDPVQAESSILNLLFNARDAMPAGGTLVLHARNARSDDGMCGALVPADIVIIAVHDSGSGMDEATRAQAFDPFFTTKAFGKGAGLGLSMVQGFCHQSGGEIRILSGGAVGTRVELWLPAAAGNGAMGDEISANLASLGRPTGRVLLVEDEHDAPVPLAAVLVSGGFEVVAVTNGADGLARLGDREPYDAVLSDDAMSDMAGADFLARVAVQAPNLPMLMISGIATRQAAPPAPAKPVRRLRRPVRPAELLDALRDAIAETRAERAQERDAALQPTVAAAG